MDNEAKYNRLLDESSRLWMGWDSLTLDNIKGFPILGKGEETPPYYALLFSELAASCGEKSNYLVDRLLGFSMDDPGKTLARKIQTIVGGNTTDCWTRQVEAMLCVYACDAWFDLLLRWQLEVIRKLSGNGTLTLDRLRGVQQEFGSGVWPNGVLMPDLSVSERLWEQQLLSDSYPGLLISRCWPFDDLKKTPMIFAMDGNDVSGQWFEFTKTEA